MEAGYPTSATCNSSEDLQSQFVEEMFIEWDKHHEQIKMIVFSWLADLSQADVDKFEQQYQISDIVFLEYLRTLGFRTYSGNGTDKKALNTFKSEAAARGF